MQKVILEFTMDHVMVIVHADVPKVILSHTKIPAWMTGKVHTMILNQFNNAIFLVFIIKWFLVLSCFFFISSCSVTEGYTRIHDGACTGPHSCKEVTGDFIAYENSCTCDLG